MGNLIYNKQKANYFIYNRDKNDKWEKQPLINNENEGIKWHYGRFKHLFFELATEKTTYDYFKIYLYENNTRLTRCELSTDKKTVTVIHSNSTASEYWESCKRSKLFGNKFDKNFKIVKKTVYEIQFERIAYSEKLTGVTTFEVPV